MRPIQAICKNFHYYEAGAEEHTQRCPKCTHEAIWSNPLERWIEVKTDDKCNVITPPPADHGDWIFVQLDSFVVLNDILSILHITEMNLLVEGMKKQIEAKVFEIPASRETLVSLADANMIIKTMFPHRGK